jgi:hypothetical protein
MADKSGYCAGSLQRNPVTLLHCERMFWFLN